MRKIQNTKIRFIFHCLGGIWVKKCCIVQNFRLFWINFISNLTSNFRLLSYLINNFTNNLILKLLGSITSIIPPSPYKKLNFLKAKFKLINIRVSFLELVKLEWHGFEIAGPASTNFEQQEGNKHEPVFIPRESKTYNGNATRSRIRFSLPMKRTCWWPI